MGGEVARWRINVRPLGRLLFVFRVWGENNGEFSPDWNWGGGPDWLRVITRPGYWPLIGWGGPGLRLASLTGLGWHWAAADNGVHFFLKQNRGLRNDSVYLSTNIHFSLFRRFTYPSFSPQPLLKPLVQPLLLSICPDELEAARPVSSGQARLQGGLWVVSLLQQSKQGCEDEHRDHTEAASSPTWGQWPPGYWASPWYTSQWPRRTRGVTCPCREQGTCPSKPRRDTCSYSSSLQSILTGQKLIKETGRDRRMSDFWGKMLYI